MTRASSPLRLRLPFARGFFRWGAPPPPPSGVRGAHARRERGAVEVVIREVQVLQARQARERVHARAGADDVIAQVELVNEGHARAGDASTPLMPRPLDER